MASAGIEILTDRKWKADKALEVAKSGLLQKALEAVATSQNGLGYSSRTLGVQAQGKEKSPPTEDEV